MERGGIDRDKTGLAAGKVVLIPVDIPDRRSWAYTPTGSKDSSSSPSTAPESCECRLQTLDEASSHDWLEVPRRSTWMLQRSNIAMLVALRSLSRWIASDGQAKGE